MTISCAILTGGLSRRMGTDKAFLPVSGRPMALAIARLLQRVSGSEPFLVAKSPKKYLRLGLPVVRDALSRRCALAGIHAALRYADTDRVLIVTCDQPSLRGPLLREMIRMTGDVVVCEVGKKIQPFPAIFSTDLLDVVADSFARGVLSVQENLFIRGFPTILADRDVRDLDPDLETFRNVNDPQSYARLTGTRVDPNPQGYRRRL
ncbi:molybdenum cofactor guanylyltransferase [bacterium]|nr:molybdenum cofactor guanylyltransferase [bacterium]